MKARSLTTPSQDPGCTLPPPPYALRVTWRFVEWGCSVPCSPMWSTGSGTRTSISLCTTSLSPFYLRQSRDTQTLLFHAPPRHLGVS